ncbi:Cytochrome [Smittium mucronatum]|uniref:Cytochrome n=1 Tax=Smittium mucronatum TaxID=133383 RepID=A0A1R0H9B5_9FUNG|nr:Cytochrome [Smittium mucronatum]
MYLALFFHDSHPLWPNKVSVSNHKGVKQALSSYRYPKSEDKNTYKILAENTFATSNEDFNRLRRKQFGQIFNQSGIRHLENVVLEYGYLNLKAKMDRLSRSGINRINYYSSFQNSTVDTISKLCFGRSFNTTKEGKSRYVEYAVSTIKLSVLENYGYVPGVIPFFFSKLGKDRDELFKFIKESVDNRKVEFESGTVESNQDILHMYLNSVNLDGKKLSEIQVISETIVVFLAGADSTSCTMSVVLHILLLYPEIFNKIVNEVRTQFTEKSKSIEYREAKTKLPYLIACIYESMRIMSVAVGLVFRDSSDFGMEIAGHQIPKSVEVGLSLSLSGHDPSVWDSPEKFTPERFLGPEGESRKKEVLLFSHGVRSCPGKK